MTPPSDTPWTDDRVDVLIHKVAPGDLFKVRVIRESARALIRAAVAEARREEREACAALCADLTPSAHWDARDMRVADMIKHAILARGGGKRDA